MAGKGKRLFRPRLTPPMKVNQSMVNAICPKNGQKTDSDRLAEAKVRIYQPDRTADWLRMMGTGKSVGEIAEIWTADHPEDAVSANQVLAYVQQYARVRDDENTYLGAVVRARQLDMSDQMIQVFLPVVLDPEAALPDKKTSAQMVLAIARHVADLTGAFAPERKEITGAHGGGVHVIHDFAQIAKDFTAARRGESAAPALPCKAVIDVECEDVS